MRLKTMKWLLMAVVLLVAGCSNGGDEPGSEVVPDTEEGVGKEEEKVPAIDKVIEELCSGSVFAEYEVKEYSSSGVTYKAPSRRKAYKFTSDGKGTTLTYTFNNSARGYAISNGEFTWRKDSDTGLAIKEGSLGTFVLNAMELTDTGVKFQGGEWEKEMEKPQMVKKADLLSYNVENLSVWLGSIRDEYGYVDPAVWMTPAVLTLKTKQGVLRYFIGNATCGKWYYDGGGTLYMATLKGEHAYNIFVVGQRDFEDGEKNSNHDNWIKVAEIKDDKLVSCIENGKDYKLE